MDIIYEIKDTQTNLKYIGSKKNWQGPGTYFGSPNSKKIKHKKYPLQQIWKEAVKNRPASFELVILESYDDIDHEILLLREIYWQKYFNVLHSMEYINAGYAKKGYLGNIFELLTDDEAQIVKDKISKSLIEKYSKLSDEEKQIRFAKYGEDNPNYGNQWNAYQRQQASLRVKEEYENGSYLSDRNTKNNVDAFGEKKAKEISTKLSQLASERIGELNPFFGKQHSNKTKEKMRQKKLGIKPVNTKIISIDGIEYSGLTEASKITGIKSTTIWHRIKSKNQKFKNYFYKENVNEKQI